MDDIIHSMDMSLSKLQEIVKDTETRCTTVHGVTKKVDTETEQQHYLCHIISPLQTNKLQSKSVFLSPICS